MEGPPSPTLRISSRWTLMRSLPMRPAILRPGKVRPGVVPGPVVPCSRWLLLPCVIRPRRWPHRLMVPAGAGAQQGLRSKHGGLCIHLHSCKGAGYPPCKERRAAGPRFVFAGIRAARAEQAGAPRAPVCGASPWKPLPTLVPATSTLVPSGNMAATSSACPGWYSPTLAASMSCGRAAKRWRARRERGARACRPAPHCCRLRGCCCRRRIARHCMSAAQCLPAVPLHLELAQVLERRAAPLFEMAQLRLCDLALGHHLVADLRRRRSGQHAGPSAVGGGRSGSGWMLRRLPCRSQRLHTLLPGRTAGRRQQRNPGGLTSGHKWPSPLHTPARLRSHPSPASSRRSRCCPPPGPPQWPALPGPRV